MNFKKRIALIILLGASATFAFFDAPVQINTLQTETAWTEVGGITNIDLPSFMENSEALNTITVNDASSFSVSASTSSQKSLNIEATAEEEPFTTPEKQPDGTYLCDGQVCYLE